MQCVTILSFESPAYDVSIFSGESERYRNTLRRRDQEIKDYQETSALQAIENQKWAKEHDNYEDRIAHLEAELSIAQQAHLQLDAQKQENLMLKETIDRMRFDMDELRSNATSAALGGSSGQNSVVNSVSKSLGAELLGKMKHWGMEDVEEDVEEEGDSGEIGANGSGDGEGTEDVIQTIITRKRVRKIFFDVDIDLTLSILQKVAGRANITQMRRFEEVKEYSDAYTQHEASDFVYSRTTQTDPEPKVLSTVSSVQTDGPELAPSSVPTNAIETEVQTQDSDTQRSRSSTPSTASDDDAMASSSSTVLPPTPKAQVLTPLHPHTNDLPPAYNQISEQDQDDRDWRVAAETLKKWHKGVKIPFEPAPAGVSDDALEEWRALKEELGIECMVIDKVISTSEKTGASRSPRSHTTSDTSTSKSRFYNIYNTYVYGTRKEGFASFPTQFALGVGVTVLMVLAISPYMVPHYSVPGGPTYYDRSAWNSFNTMQAAGEGFGFSPDGTTLVWSFLGRVGGGAARIARGWPT
jgi:hypothetical protein